MRQDISFVAREIEDHTPRGYVVHQIDAYLAGATVGYIRVSFLSKSLSYQLMPTPWHYMSLHKGWCFNVNDIKTLWKRAHLYASRSPASRPDLAPWSICDDDVPDVETMETDLAILGKPYLRKMREDIRRGGNTPIVEYIKVDDALQRQGIGTQLYIAMSKFLAEHYAMPLYASTLQSPEAAAVWQDMRHKGFPISRCLIRGRKRYCLSYISQ